jgi:hypothetical protein
MATGEGKTLVATLPGLPQRPHRHAGACGHGQRLPGPPRLGVDGRGVQVPRPDRGLHPEPDAPAERRLQYACDITYGTNAEFGFDYLRDNGMAYRPEDMVQRGHYYAIVDEIDSILIDEARTPLIISGPAQTSSSHSLMSSCSPPRRAPGPPPARAVQQAGSRRRRSCWRRARIPTTAACKMYQMQQGMPKHPQLHAAVRGAPRAALREGGRAAAHRMRKDEAASCAKSCTSPSTRRATTPNLTEKGCEALSPNDPDAYVLPDLVSQMSELDGLTGLSDEEKFSAGRRSRSRYARRASASTRWTSSSAPTAVYERDVQYVVQENQVIIVDENTGRLMPGRRWSDGLHQAVEAKEGSRSSARPRPRHHHHPELLPHVREAGRHDRHGRDRGGRVPPDLQARRAGHPDQPPGAPGGPQRPRLQDPAREVQGGHRRDRRVPPARAAVLVGTISVETSASSAACCASAEHPAQRAERQEPRSARPRSCPWPARRARSPSPPTWPAAAPTSSWARAWSTCPAT